jgi:thiol-disulfide isomerase/thioredoxin
MKKILIIPFLAICLAGFKPKDKIDLTYVLDNYNKRAKSITKIEYNMQRIDTFANGTIWNNKGYALIERNARDKVFGFSFYANRFDTPIENIYDGQYGFWYFNETRKFEKDDSGEHFLGSHGGQMILKDIFQLDSIYKSLELSEQADKYILKYTFADDTVYEVTDIVKIVELDKKSFLPMKTKYTYKQTGNRQSGYTVLSNVKMNGDVTVSIKDYKNRLKEYSLIQPEKETALKIEEIKVFSEVSLPNLLDKTDLHTIKTNKLTLIDFWEVWCGPCIKSLPEVQKIKNKYADKIQVIGIMSTDVVNARKLIASKNVTFLTLVGNKELKTKYNINQWPIYFLVDTKGSIVQKYYGFDGEKIEADIQRMIKE